MMDMRTLSAGHGALTAVQAGRGRDLIMLHSLLADRHAFDQVLPALTEKFRVTLLNMPGYNGSEPAIAALPDAYVARIEDGFQEWEIAQDAILLGNGIGATIALAFAIAHPERIERLVLNGVAAALPEQTRAALSALSETFARGGPDAIVEGAAARFYSAGYLKSHPDAVERLRRFIASVQAKSILDTYKILQEIDLVPLLHKIEMPVLVMVGEFDQATPPALNKTVAERIPGAKYVELKGCGHCPAIEQPQAFLAAIRDFVGF